MGMEMEEEEKKRRERGRASFAVTCSLLSQFLKEKRSYGEQKGREMVYRQQEKAKESYLTLPTMNLFPPSNAAAEASNKGEQKEIERNASLTIFYNGKVVIFDNVPAKKAESLIGMASRNGNSEAAGAPAASPLPPVARASDLTMPIARRASLHRFLEKRKDRIKTNAPYLSKSLQKLEPAISEIKPQKKQQSWLALGHN